MSMDTSGGNVCFVPEMIGEVIREGAGNPAAGEGFYIQLPAGYLYKMQTIYFMFATDGNAADRTVYVKFADGGGAVLAYCQSSVVQVANVTAHYTVMLGTPEDSISNTVFKNIHMPIDFYFPGLARVFINGDLWQVGDQVTAIYFSYRRWRTY